MLNYQRVMGWLMGWFMVHSGVSSTNQFRPVRQFQLCCVASEDTVFDAPMVFQNNNDIEVVIVSCLNWCIFLEVVVLSEIHQLLSLKKSRRMVPRTSRWSFNKRCPRMRPISPWGFLHVSHWLMASIVMILWLIINHILTILTIYLPYNHH
jgi:hypothetical protein